MNILADWLTKPRAIVRVETAVPWGKWMKTLHESFARRSATQRARMEVLTRLSLGGKKSLLLISVEGRRMLVAVGEEGAPTVIRLERPSMPIASSRDRSRSLRVDRRRRW